MIKPITFKNQGQKLIGILHVPDFLKVGEKAPGIAIFHGFTGNKTEAHRLFVHVARALCEAGFVVIRFDFRGSGDSDGEFEDMTVPGEVSDAHKALTFLAKQRWVDKNKIGVIGLSMGGRVASILATKDKRIKFIILYSAALTPLRERFLSGIDKETLEKLGKGEAISLNDGWYMKKPFYDSADETIPIKVMGKIKVPVLIIHSDTDQVVSVDNARKGYEIVKNLNPKNELYEVKGGNHVFTEKKQTDEVINKTLKWLSSLRLKHPR